MKKAVRVEISGTVQGVFFRSYIKETADKLSVNGYVRNREDGSVEAWFEGNGPDVDRIIEICKEGPEHSVIKKMDITEENFQGLKEFKILKM